MQSKTKVAISIAVLLFTANANAEGYSFEVRAAYDRTQFDSSFQFSDTDGSLQSGLSSDTDSLSLVGSWYFNGLSVDQGPRTRAVLLDRASSLNFLYRRADADNFSFTESTVPGFPSGEFRSDFSTDELGLSGRLVGRQSGWFVEGSFLEGDTDIAFVTEVTDRAWNIGVGRYIFETTTLALNYGEFDNDLRKVDTLGIGLEHVGSFVGSWQYGVDFNYDRVNGLPQSDDDWRISLALYPSRNLEFGVAYADQIRPIEGFSLFLSEVESVEGFLSWFVSPNVELGARYRVDDIDTFGAVDQDRFGLSLNVRF